MSALEVLSLGSAKSCEFFTKNDLILMQNNNSQNTYMNG